MLKEAVHVAVPTAFFDDEGPAWCVQASDWEL